VTANKAYVLTRKLADATMPSIVSEHPIMIDVDSTKVSSLLSLSLLPTLVFGERKNGVTNIKYRRFLQTNEPVNDQAIPLDREVSVIAAIGPLNKNMEVNSHSHRGDEITIDDIRIDFSSKNVQECPSSLYERKDENAVKPWATREISNENVITARIGPTGGKRGYTAITGHPSWGIAWYLNDLLIPELIVERGQTYTFIIEGGNDETQPAR
jgi:hypothetical protein